MRVKPNFFVIGAPKAGTTSLGEYLRQHENVFFSPIKEPNFFCNDFYTGKTMHPRDLNQYLKLFSRARKKHTAIGEGSVLYIYSEKAVQNIKVFNPDAKIILMLREPLSMVQAQHMENLLSLVEDEPDFLKAWNLYENRARGHNLPQSINFRKNLLPLVQYRDTGKLGFYLQRVLDLFPKKQVHIVLFDDLLNDARKVYEETLYFLGLPLDKRKDFPVYNESRIPKLPLRQRNSLFLWLEKSVPFEMRKIIQIGKENFGLKGSKFLGGLARQEGKRWPIPASRAKKFREHFREDISLLSDIIAKDLSHWLSDREES